MKVVQEFVLLLVLGLRLKKLFLLLGLLLVVVTKLLKLICMIDVMFEITVYKSVEDLKNKRILLRAPITCPDTFEFQACVLMFKNMYPNCVVHFSA